jgi:tetratricopeptide (TPR) repeat protein
LEFSHCKFFRKSKAKWHKKIHEVVIGIPESRLRYCEDMYLHHWQQPSANRTNFLPKLEYAVLETENDDRNTYYLAREYYYAGEQDTAIKMFERYLELPGWKPERSQALVFMGDCYKYSGRGQQAVECYHKAMVEDDTRREPFFALGFTMYEWARYRSAAIYLRAATEIPLRPNYYLNDMNLYTWRIWDVLSLVYDKLGEREKAAEAWLEAVKGAPDDQRIINNAKWFHRRVA